MENLQALNQLGFNISMSQIIAGLFFGVVGLYYFRKGKQDLNYSVLFLGIAMMAYPYVVSHDVFTWVVGFALWGAAYYFRNYDS